MTEPRKASAFSPVLRKPQPFIAAGVSHGTSLHACRMAVDFFFEPPTFTIPSLGALRTHWANVKDMKLRHVIAVEAQSLAFQRYLVESIRFTADGCCNKPTYRKPLSLSARGGAIKAAILLTASISEAVLRHHAEKRTYKLPTAPRHRTFGKVLEAWKDASGSPQPEVAGVWTELTAIHRSRNHVHLYNAAADPKAAFEYVLQVEAKIFKSIDSVLAVLRSITSP